MKTIKDFCANFSASVLLGFVLLWLCTSCETTGKAGPEGRAARGADREGLFKGLTFSIVVPPGMRVNSKRGEKEFVHYFFTPEMARRKVGMGIYEGFGAKSMTRDRDDLFSERNDPVRLDRFVGSVEAGTTEKGNKWCEYFLFPQESGFALQAWYIDVEPEDEQIFLKMIRTIKATYKTQ